MRTVFLVLFLALAAPAWAEDITATVVEIPDGDTLKVRLDGDCLPDLFRVLLVRFRGCDTPEKSDERPEVAALAREAREFTSRRLQVGSQVVLRRIAWDKYGGRLVATIETDGEDLCRQLIDGGLAREYSGKGKKPW